MLIASVKFEIKSHGFCSPLVTVMCWSISNYYGLSRLNRFLLLSVFMLTPIIWSLFSFLFRIYNDLVGNVNLLFYRWVTCRHQVEFHRSIGSRGITVFKIDLRMFPPLCTCLFIVASLPSATFLTKLR